jgi:hypothetical protein
MPEVRCESEGRANSRSHEFGRERQASLDGAIRII